MWAIFNDEKYFVCGIRTHHRFLDVCEPARRSLTRVYFSIFLQPSGKPFSRRHWNFFSRALKWLMALNDWIGLFFRTVGLFWNEWTDRTSVLFISVREGPEVPTRGARTVEEEEIVKPGKISERILNLLLAKRSYYWPFRYFCSVLICINSCSDPLF